ncbi:hypothetical protein BH24ACI2_BH24ACI2_02810 [soil metagenome]|jgi:hypothetical protein
MTNTIIVVPTDTQSTTTIDEEDDEELIEAGKNRNYRQKNACY